MGNYQDLPINAVEANKMARKISNNKFNEEYSDERTLREYRACQKKIKEAISKGKFSVICDMCKGTPPASRLARDGFYIEKYGGYRVNVEWHEKHIKK